MRLVSLAILALALFSLAPPTGAQTVTSWTMTVDGVGVNQWGTITVTGVVQGDSTPSTHSVNFVSSNDSTKTWALDKCHRALLLALAKPGQYVATVGYNVCTVALVTP